MSRPIKFRAWCFATFYCPNAQMVIPGTFEAAQIMGLYHLDDFIDNEDFQLMQFTGLTDKNGREIYEGDIVESEIPACRHVVIFLTDTCGFFLRPIIFKGYDFFMNQAKSLEVVGNIYENPLNCRRQKNETFFSRNDFSCQHRRCSDGKRLCD